MNLSSKKIIKEILKKYNIKPSKKFGQNFLIDKTVIRKIIKTAELKPKDVVLEIGPGIGALTQEIATRAGKVIAVEKDPKMCEVLKETLKDFDNIKIIKGDIIKFNIKNPKSEIRNPKQIQKNYKIIANLPFYLTAPVIRKFIEAVDVKHQQPQQMVLVVQKEVGQRICAKPPKMSILAVSVQFYAKVKTIDYVSKSSFWPKPKVDAAIIKIIPHSSAYISLRFRDQFFKIVRAGFSHPRKQILNNFEKELKLNKASVKQWLVKNNIKPSQRSETLFIQDWLNLTKTLDKTSWNRYSKIRYH
ncbi:ribosomal RNA small subunit methyltransferase A [Candidatus Parcubacteria bacterium]|nr:ribosomal RNA small subunit methyltransferase A [Candidatus Parcubacteria bacterium]